MARLGELAQLTPSDMAEEREDVDDERKTTHGVLNNTHLLEGGPLYGGLWQSLTGA